MDKEEMIKKITELDARLSADYPIADGAAKAGVGFGATFGAMTINDWVGLAVGLATLVYMILQIENALKRRKQFNDKRDN